MFVVLARDTRGNTSVYGAFPRQSLAEEWAQLQIVRDIELIVCPVLDPRSDRRRGQMSELATDWPDNVAQQWDR